MMLYSLSQCDHRGFVSPRWVGRWGDRQLTTLEGRGLEPSARRLALQLGLGDLNDHASCAGYAHCCECEACLERQESVSSAFLSWLESEVEPMPRYRHVSKTMAQPWVARRAA